MVCASSLAFVCTWRSGILLPFNTRWKGPILSVALITGRKWLEAPTGNRVKETLTVIATQKAHMSQAALFCQARSTASLIEVPKTMRSSLVLNILLNFRYMFRERFIIDHILLLDLILVRNANSQLISMHFHESSHECWTFAIIYKCYSFFPLVWKSLHSRLDRLRNFSTSQCYTKLCRMHRSVYYNLFLTYILN